MSESGTFLNVAILSPAPRLTGSFWQKTAFILNYSVFNPERDAETFWFQEGIDPAKGTLLQQVAFCGSWNPEQDEGNPKRLCLDERATVIFSSAGMPGGFGAAPHWTRAIEPGEALSVPSESKQRPAPDLVYDVEVAQPGDGFEGPCLRLSAGSSSEYLLMRPLPATVASGPVILCGGVPLPIAFESVTGERFHLQAYRPADSDQENPVPVARSARLGQLSRETWQQPFLVDPAPTPLGKDLTVREAHETALEADGEYAKLFQRDPEPLVVRTDVLREFEASTGSNDSVEIRRETYRRALVAVDPGTGEAVEAVVEKTVQEVNPSDGPGLLVAVLPGEAELVEERRLRLERFPTAASAHPEQVSIPWTWSISSDLANLELEADNVGVRPIIRSHPWLPLRPTEWHDRTDGYTVYIWANDPDPSNNGNLPVFVMRPYEMVFDGPSGEPMWFQTNATNLPIDGRHLG